MAAMTSITACAKEAELNNKHCKQEKNKTCDSGSYITGFICPDSYSGMYKG